MYRIVSSCHGLREKEEAEEKGRGDADVQASHTDYPDCSRNSTRGNTLYLILSSVCVLVGSIRQGQK